MRQRHKPPGSRSSDPWLPRRGTTVLLLSASADLQGAVGRVSAAASVELIVGGLEHAAGRWSDVAAVLVDAHEPVDAAVGAGLAAWRGPTAVVGFARDSQRVWQQAERLGADRVAILPDSAPWLANFLGCLRNPDVGAGVVGVVGACGGAGASTLAILVAAEAARRGSRTLLVDGDPWGGGLCTALSAGDVPGLRWPELLHASGSINPEQLAASLPQLAGVSLLSWGGPRQDSLARAAAPGMQPPDNAVPDPAGGRTAEGEVMRAARGAYGLVVVDVGRNPGALISMARQCSGLLVVVPAELRAASAALQMMDSLPPMPLGAVVRDPLGEGLDAAMVAAAVDLPLVGRLPRLRGVAEALEARRLPELLRRRRVGALLGGILGWMSGEGVNNPRKNRSAVVHEPSAGPRLAPLGPAPLRRGAGP